MIHKHGIGYAHLFKLWPDEETSAPAPPPPPRRGAILPQGFSNFACLHAPYFMTACPAGQRRRQQLQQSQFGANTTTKASQQPHSTSTTSPKLCRRREAGTKKNALSPEALAASQQTDTCEVWACVSMIISMGYGQKTENHVSNSCKLLGS